MRVLGPSEVAAALHFPDLIEALRGMIRARDFVAQQGQRYVVRAPDGRDGLLSITPAWQEGRHLGIELVTAFPESASRDDATVLGEYLLLDGYSGRPLALLDGRELAARRIAATSALATTYLARPDCERLLMIGAGWPASQLIEAHASVRPIRHVLVWDREFNDAARLALRMTRRTLNVAATNDLRCAVNGAHVICCATDAREPILRGYWLPIGVHVDLVLGHIPHARPADDEVLRRASIFVDGRGSVLPDGGSAGDIVGDLFDLTRGGCPGRRFKDEITLFKSVGLTFLDLAAAKLAIDGSAH